MYRHIYHTVWLGEIHLNIIKNEGEKKANLAFNLAQTAFLLLFCTYNNNKASSTVEKAVKNKINLH